MNVGAPAHEDNVSAVAVTPRGVVAAVKPPLKTIMAVPISSVRMLISNSLLPYAFPKVALRELQVNVWVIFLVVNDSHDYVE
jgi:threonine/homoserine efflux transporter RhtA